MAVFQAEGISAGYGAGDIIHDVALAVRRDRIVTIIGPNGSGKSTLIKVLAGLLRARTGRIRLGERDVTGLDAASRVRAGVAYVPQENNVFRNLTVAENLSLAVEFLGRRGDAGQDGAVRARVLALFPDLGGRLADFAGNLSGGQRQMLAFACALMADPAILLLDEPTAGVSPKFAADIFATVKAVHAAGVAILMVEQNAAQALAMSDDAIVMAGGEIRLAAPAAEVASDHEIHRLYLGGAG